MADTVFPVNRPDYRRQGEVIRFIAPLIRLSVLGRLSPRCGRNIADTFSKNPPAETNRVSRCSSVDCAIP